jgi:hypothetical protein
MVKRIGLLVAGLLLISTVANAGSNWQSLSFTTTPADLPKVVAALDKLMSSAGPGDKGTVSLMANVAGGDGSHSFISSFDSRAAREAWSAGLQTSPAWGEFTAATSGLIDRGASSRMDFVKSWGKESDKDVFWEIYAYSVTDASAFSGALDTFLATEAGKGFPGQVRLSTVAASGLSQVTHLLSVGYESEAESEGWGDPMANNPDFASYQEASRRVSTLAGSFMIRTIQTWGGSDE